MSYRELIKFYCLMNKVLGAIIGVLSILLLSAGPALAQPNFANAELSTASTPNTLVLPTPAIENSPVISLGSGVDPQTGKVVEGLAFIHFKKEFTHKPNHPNAGNGSTTKCYSYLSQGAKWKTIEDYLVDPTNTSGLAAGDVRSILANASAKWEDAADGAVNGVAGANILGNEIAGVVDGADTGSPDGKNEVMFADISSSGAIAVTIVWGIFAGPPSGRQLVEWDQVYDDVDFDWSTTGDAGKMDLDNIVTHEIGHSDGMGHPDDSCTEETMYRFGSLGEAKKQTLNAGDIAGINLLY